MHHKWNQQSGNQGSDLYIATVDDFIWALIAGCPVLPISEG
jgi:hypothetical protein